MKRKTLVRLERTLGCSALILALLIMLIPGRAFADSEKKEENRTAVDASAATIDNADKITAVVNGGDGSVCIFKVADTDRQRLEALYGSFNPENQILVTYDLSLVSDAADSPAAFSSVQITMPLPSVMDPDHGRVQVISEREEQFEELSFSLNRENSISYVTFTATHFSDYGFLYTKEEETDQTEPEPEPESEEEDLSSLRAGGAATAAAPSGAASDPVTMQKEGVCDVGKLGTLHYEIYGVGNDCTLRIFAPDAAAAAASSSAAYDLPDYTWIDSAGTYDYPWRYFVDDITSLILEAPLHNISANAFAGMKIKNEVIIPDSVVTIGETAFYGCQDMKGVTIGSGVTSIGASAFGSTGIISLDLSTASSLSSVGEAAFADCARLIGPVVWANGVQLSNYVFANDVSLRYMDLSGTGITTIPDYAFVNCTGFQDNGFVYPAGLTAIGAHAFENMGDGGLFPFTSLTSLTSIGDYAFYNCKYQSKNPTFPASLTAIGSHAFARANGLSGTLSFTSTNITLGDRAFSGDDIPDSGKAPTVGTAEIGNSTRGQFDSIQFDGTAALGMEAFAEQPYLSTVYFGLQTGTATPAATFTACDTPGGDGYSTQTFPTKAALYYPIGAAGWDSPYYGNYPCYPVDFSDISSHTSFALIDDKRGKKTYTESIMAIVGDNDEVYTLEVEDSKGKKIKENMKLKDSQLLSAYELTLLNGVDEKATDFGVCKIYLPVPKDMKSNGTVEVVAIKDGKIERNLPSGIVAYREDGIRRIWFTTDHFSEYGLVYSGASQDNNGGNNDGNNNNGGNNNGNNNGGNNNGGNNGGNNDGQTANNNNNNNNQQTQNTQQTTAQQTPNQTTQTTAAQTTAAPNAAATTTRTTTAAANTPASVTGKTDMPKTGEGDEIKFMIVGMLALFGLIMLVLSIPTKKKLKA